MVLDGDILTVNINAAGLTPDMIHPQHTHGRADPVTLAPLPATTPVDLEHDGFLETPEGELAVGAPILPLTYPTAPGGVINFSQTYNLNDPSIYAPEFTQAQLLPREFRVVELHGMTLGQADLPVASLGAIIAGRKRLSK